MLGAAGLLSITAGAMVAYLAERFPAQVGLRAAGGDLKSTGQRGKAGNENGVGLLLSVCRKAMRSAFSLCGKFSW
jgi:hypothetical protein